MSHQTTALFDLENKIKAKIYDDFIWKTFVGLAKANPDAQRIPILIGTEYDHNGIRWTVTVLQSSEQDGRIFTMMPPGQREFYMVDLMAVREEMKRKELGK